MPFGKKSSRSCRFEALGGKIEGVQVDDWVGLGSEVWVSAGSDYEIVV